MTDPDPESELDLFSTLDGIDADWARRLIAQLDQIAADRARDWPVAMRGRDPVEGPPEYPTLRGVWWRGRQVRNAIDDLADYNPDLS